MRANIMRVTDGEMFGEIFERANEAFLVFDEHLEIVSVNRAASKLISTTLDTKQPRFADQAALLVAMASASRVGEWAPLRITLASGEDAHAFDARLRRLRDEPCAHRYIVSLDKNAADREAFKALRQEVVRAHARSAEIEAAKKRLTNVIEATQAGCWEWDVRSGSVWVNDLWRKMLGMEAEDSAYSIHQWKRLCHPDDINKGWAHIKACLCGKTQTRELEARVRHKNGHWVWVAVTSRIVERHKDGRPAVIAGTQVDITQRKAHERELEEKSVQAEAANIAKSQFLATMSHEIRTPMNGVLGMLDVVLNSQLTAQDREHIDIARTSAQSLLRILNDILDFSKLEAGAVEIECAPYSPRQLIEQVTALLGPRAEEKGLRLNIDKRSEIPEMLAGDAVRLRQVLINLIGNAIKFTDSGSVEVSARMEKSRNSDRLMITVRDTGIGIPEDVTPRLFKHFAQADSSMSRRFGGTGLGLVICKQIVELMGGEIGVRSVEEKGSAFWIAIPAREPKECSADGCLKDATETAFGPLSNAPPMRILAADDHPVNQQVLRCFLAAGGHTAVIVENGQEALHALDHGSFDAIIMDIEMPVMDGLAATKAIRARAGPDRDTPIIAVTAHALAGDREQYLSAGMNDYISKPFNQEDLQAALARAAGIRPPKNARAEVDASEGAPAKASTG